MRNLNLIALRTTAQHEKFKHVPGPAQDVRCFVPQPVFFSLMVYWHFASLRFVSMAESLNKAVLCFKEGAQRIEFLQLI